ncbi:MAG: hypothetical protein KF760_08385 [Candidatus Eremiobacteraeota bacterium]|nr:hypothetical protein [Candidatus Eremiobacteraeota bacterium]MCW5870890.1 hypothetical protein [Candidatus Eremiobacteraeota bacterium]
MISVSEWVPSYGDPHQLEDEQEYARVWEHAELQAVDTPLTPRPRVAFVDGVRRAEALLYLDEITAVAGVLAAGAAVPGGGYAGVRVERVFLRAAEVRLPPQAGGWSWRSLLIPADLNAELALQRAMRELEAEIGLALAREGYALVLDGPMATALPRAVGYVKTQQRSLLPPEQNEALGKLRAGQRSSMFAWGSKHGCYMRLSHDREHQHPYHGLVRLECMGEAESCRAWLHEVAGWLPAFAGVAHLDPRAPQNLQPIAGLEKELRRRCGDPGLALRAVRQAVAQLQKGLS